VPDAKNNDGKITRVQDLLDLINKSGFAERGKAHVRDWFRGNPKQIGCFLWVFTDLPSQQLMKARS
jgi:hypothetical protein